MTNIEKTKKLIWNLFDILRGTVGYYDLYSSATHLIFLKYLVSYSDRLDTLNVESFKALASFKRKYDNAKNGTEPLETGDINELFHVLDSNYVFHDMKLSDSIRTYDEIFRNQMYQRRILMALEEVDFESDNDFLGSFFEYLVMECGRDARMTGESVTSKSIRELVSALLSVNKNDRFLNCFSGFSSITLNIKEFGTYTGYEINQRTFIVSKMLLIMRGMEYANIINEDFLISDTHESANKIFSDGPISMKYDNPGLQYYFNVKTKDADLLILYKVLDSLMMNGTAAIVVPGKVLFSENNSFKEMRDKFVDNGIKALIALPPLWSGLSIPTNLLIVEKGYTGDVEFVDAKDFGSKMKGRTNVVLSSEEVSRIVEAVNNKETINNFCVSASRQKVKEVNSWQPHQYIEMVPANSFRDINEIDTELDSLYEELKNNLK